MNTILAIGVFAAISREYGIPLRYPGGEGHVKDACDARVLAQAMEWAGETAACANEAFNIANGDCFTWEELWPRFAGAFAMPHAAPHSFSLGKVMPGKDDVWERIVRKHGLAPYSYQELVPSWDFTDFSLRYGQAPTVTLLSTIKARRAGFTPCADTEDMYVQLLRDYQAANILPT
jgi:hypothetical protein